MTADPASSIVVNNVRVEFIERGRGKPLLFLHPEIGIEPASPVLDQLASRTRVLVPVHPGFGRSEQPRSFDTVDDLAYFYLDLLEHLDLRQIIVVGYRSAAGLPPRSRSSRANGCRTSCSRMQ